MEETELSFTTTAWLQEGLWLKEMVIRLAGASLVASFIEAGDAFRRLPWRCPGSTAPTTPEECRVRRRHDELHKACVTPLVNALNGWSGSSRSGRIMTLPDLCA